MYVYLYIYMFLSSMNKRWNTILLTDHTWPLLDPCSPYNHGFSTESCLPLNVYSLLHGLFDVSQGPGVGRHRETAVIPPPTAHVLLVWCYDPYRTLFLLLYALVDSPVLTHSNKTGCPLLLCFFSALTIELSGVSYIFAQVGIVSLCQTYWMWFLKVIMWKQPLASF